MHWTRHDYLGLCGPDDSATDTQVLSVVKIRWGGEELKGYGLTKGILDQDFVFFPWLGMEPRASSIQGEGYW